MAERGRGAYRRQVHLGEGLDPDGIEDAAAGIEAIRKHKATYLMAVGGAAYLVSKAITQARVVAFAELGMEAIWEIEVEDFPAFIIVDDKGNDVYSG